MILHFKNLHTVFKYALLSETLKIGQNRRTKFLKSQNFIILGKIKRISLISELVRDRAKQTKIAKGLFSAETLLEMDPRRHRSTNKYNKS